MSELTALLVPLLILVVSGAAVIWLPRTAATWAGVTSALVMAILVPSFYKSANVAIVAVIGTIAVLGLTLWRDRDSFRRWPTPVVLICFIAWSSTVGSIGSPIALIGLNLATGVLLVALVFVTIAAVRRGFNIFVPLFAAVVVFETLLGLSEEFLGFKSMWPRASGSDIIANRVNSVLPALVGRAMGSTSQPIPYGLLIGFSIVVCLWFAANTYRGTKKSIWLYAISAFGVAGLIFSGSRSAFIGLAVVLVLWALMRVWGRPWVRYGLIGLVVIAVPTFVILALALGGAELRDSRSFVHRLGIIETAGNLFTRSPLDVLFGSGYNSTQSLIRSGIVKGAAGVSVYDEEFVRTFASLGIIGLILLIAAIVAGLRRGNELTRLLLVFMVCGFFSFDSLSWRLLATLFVIVTAYGYGLKKSSGGPPGTVASADRPIVAGSANSSVRSRFVAAISLARN